MDKFQIFLMFAGAVGLVGFGALMYVFLGGTNNRGGSGVRELMAAGGAMEPQGRRSRRNPNAPDPYDLDAEEFRKQLHPSRSKQKPDDISTKLFRAGLFSAEDRKWFLRFRIIAFGISLFALPS
jgi:hypothetical protein